MEERKYIEDEKGKIIVDATLQELMIEGEKEQNDNVERAEGIDFETMNKRADVKRSGKMEEDEGGKERGKVHKMRSVIIFLT